MINLKIHKEELEEVKRAIIREIWSQEDGLQIENLKELRAIKLESILLLENVLKRIQKPQYGGSHND
jgi:hypothetical protein